MSFEELKLLVDTLAALGESSINAFIIYIITSQLVGPITWLITCTLLLIYVPKGIARVAYSTEEAALLEIRHILRPNYDGHLTDREITELISIIKRLKNG